MHERLRCTRRTRPRRPVAAAGPLMLAVAAALSACTASPPLPPAPRPLPTTSMTQEQQDDQAFQDVFVRYVNLDLGTEKEEDLAPLLTGTALQGELESLQYSIDRHQHVVGKPTASGFRITDRGTDPEGVPYMTAQACMDLSGTRTLDADGNDVTPSRDERLALQMKAVRIPDGTLRITDSLRNEETRACD
jgi:hypothetical protein